MDTLAAYKTGHVEQKNVTHRPEKRQDNQARFRQKKCTVKKV